MSLSFSNELLSDLKKEFQIAREFNSERDYWAWILSTSLMVWSNHCQATGITESCVTDDMVNFFIAKTCYGSLDFMDQKRIIAAAYNAVESCKPEIEQSEK